MKTIIICEKPSQATNLEKALGTSHGEIYPMAGHLIGYKLPEETDPKLEKWGHDLILPQGKKSLGKAKFLKPIEEALKKADNVIIATDCDREGTLLGREILDFFSYRKSAQRAIFTAEDEKSLREAFEKLKPLSTTDNEYSAAKSREIADYILGLTLTRGVTASFGAFVSVGRVKTPTFAMVVRREHDIRNFKPQNYYNLELEIKGLKLNYNSDPMVLNPEEYKDILNNKPSTCLIEKETKEGKKKPPKPFDLLALTKALSSSGVSAKKVLELAQSLYDKHKIATYPRSESRYIPLNMLNSSIELFGKLKNLYDFPAEEPVIRKGKSGVFFDGEASHHAIIPNINSNIQAIYPNLNELEKKAFDLIAKQFIASLSPDAEFIETKYSTEIDGYQFKKSGKVFTFLGYLEVLNEDKEKSDALPKLNEGEYEIKDICITTHITKPPSRFTEATLADAMKNAWRFVEDEKYKEMLKETSGIGTQATRADIIEALKSPKQDIFGELEKKYIIPTEKALKIYDVLDKVIPQLLDPSVTAMWELSLSMIEQGKIKEDVFINRVIERTKEYVQSVKENVDAIPKELTKKQIMLAKKLSKDFNRPLPNLDNYEETKSFVDNIKKDIKEGKIVPPSTSNQVSLAKKLATEHNLNLPKDMNNGIEVSKFIDKVLNDIKEGRLESVIKLPSKKQLDFAKKLARKNGKIIPEEALSNSRLLSEFIKNLK